MRIQKTIGWLLALTPLLALFSCESDDTMPDSQQGERVPVTIRLGVEGSGLATRAEGDESYTKDVLTSGDDVISSVDVYIVDSDNTTQHLVTGAFNNTTWVSTDELTLPTGTAHVYAVANYYSSTETAQETAPSNTAVNALSKISTTIPMSADTTWTIESGTSSYEVRLNRMVAQMQVSIVEGDINGTTESLSSWNISDFKIESLLPATTNLYRESYGNVTLPTDVKRSDWTWDSPQVGEEKGTAFYLHETEGTFTISLNDGTRKRSNTFTTEIPRNHILPLVVHLTDYRLDFEGSSYQHGPIGVVKDPIKRNGYNIEFPEGASAVYLKVALKNADSETMENVSWTSSITQTGSLPTLELGELTPSEDNVLTVLNNYDFPAGLTGTIALTLTATFIDGGKSVTQSFPITITVREINDGDATRTRSASNEAEPIIVEL